MLCMRLRSGSNLPLTASLNARCIVSLPQDHLLINDRTAAHFACLLQPAMRLDGLAGM